MHWCAWDELCKPTTLGGMGFRHLFAFNLAMLAKQGWRIIQNPNSLVERLLKAIYFPHYSFWEAEIGTSPSYEWISIVQGRDILEAGIRKHIGNGNQTDIWKEPWVPEWIITIPVSVHNYEDQWIWGEDRKGRFSVKLAYHVARRQIQNEDDDEPNPSARLWKHLWKAPVPGKVKICVWKATSNILPKRNRLSQRGIDIDTVCPLCDEEVESPLHAL
ncbi:hypothetical protein ACLB2K_013386 [Fragaria x ananassa]